VTDQPPVGTPTRPDDGLRRVLTWVFIALVGAVVFGLIAGILACVRTSVQVLAVDDNSPDGTWQVVEEIAAREPRVRLLRHCSREHRD